VGISFTISITKLSSCKLVTLCHELCLAILTVQSLIKGVDQAQCIKGRIPAKNADKVLFPSSVLLGNSILRMLKFEQRTKMSRVLCSASGQNQQDGRLWRYLWSKLVLGQVYSWVVLSCSNWSFYLLLYTVYMVPHNVVHRRKQKGCIWRSSWSEDTNLVPNLSINIVWYKRNWHLEHGSKRQWIRMHKMRMSDRVPDSLQPLPGHR